jgi:hypothetical protein
MIVIYKFVHDEREHKTFAKLVGDLKDDSDLLGFGIGSYACLNVETDDDGVPKSITSRRFKEVYTTASGLKVRTAQR